MQIDRSNYEVWVIDWLDGKLNEEQTGKLFQFFKENPDLKEESEDLGILKVSPSEKTFRKKKNLKKTPANITDSQFEFLCAAYIENDLNEEQVTELKEAISDNPLRAESFELFRKTKLVPLNITYKGKSRLLRKTLAQKIIRASYISLSAAAIILFAVITFVSRQPSLKVTPGKIAEATLSDKKELTVPARTSDAGGEIKTKKSSENKNLKKESSSGKPAMGQKIIPDASPESRVTAIEKVRILPEISLAHESLPDKLVAFNAGPVTTIVYEEVPETGRAKIGKFLARTFREKILNEEVPEDTPLKAYEIAEAGVSGLNKILGWQMALDEKTDDSGNPRSVYFSSKILKFNAPVKKSEPSQ